MMNTALRHTASQAGTSHTAVRAEETEADSLASNVTIILKTKKKQKKTTTHTTQTKQTNKTAVTTTKIITIPKQEVNNSKRT